MRYAAPENASKSCVNVKLAQPLCSAAMHEIERMLHLRYNKWDTQAGDVSTLSEQSLVLSQREWDLLCHSAERLAAETERMESAVLETFRSHSLIGVRRLGVPKAIWEAIAPMKNNISAYIARAMRFDFHPTTAGWCVTEINSDVPGGWREGASLPILYQPFFPGLCCPPSPLAAWGDAAQAVIGDGYAALLSASGYLEDEQVVRTFMGELQSRRIPCCMIRSPAALQWDRGYGCMLRGSNQRISLVIRFYQAEWLCALPIKTGWQKLLQTTEIPIINPTISVISESKRFPLVFNDVTNYPAWKALVPVCRDPREVDANDWESWVLKACYSNTGDKVYICGKLSKEQRKRLIREAQGHPLRWVAQRRFETLPLEFRGGLTHPCIGVFVVNGCAAGAYVRLSAGQITDFAAVETPLLIERTDC